MPAAAIESFRTKGYALLPRFLTEAELLPIETLYDQFMRGEIMTQKVHGKDFCDMSQPFETPFEQWRLVNAMLPTRYSPFMKKASSIYAARAASVARQLFPKTPMAFDYDQLLNKRPMKEGAVFPWHQDMAYVRSEGEGKGGGEGGGVGREMLYAAYRSASHACVACTWCERARVAIIVAQLHVATPPPTPPPVASHARHKNRDAVPRGRLYDSGERRAQVYHGQRRRAGAAPLSPRGQVA